ncbi:hypothetical protein BHE74_00006220 [Ensete ventricosum]|nr:hypothetical protein BHE74_00006220 [Ensete ventricosum]
MNSANDPFVRFLRGDRVTGSESVGLGEGIREFSCGSLLTIEVPRVAVAEIDRGDDVGIARKLRGLATEEMDDQLFVGGEELETRRDATFACTQSTCGGDGGGTESWPSFRLFWVPSPCSVKHWVELPFPVGSDGGGFGTGCTPGTDP